MNGSVMSAYLIGVVVMAISLVIAMVLTNGVKESAKLSNAQSPRRVRFWSMTILTPLVTLAVAYFAVYQDIHVPSRQAAYMTAMAISAGVFFVVQIILGFLLSKTALCNKRLQSWF